MERKCVNCGIVLARDNTGELCSPCEKKQPDQRTIYDEEIIDADGYAAILGLDSAEQLKRLARDGKLAPRIPEIKEWKWYKKDIDAWISQKQKEEIQSRDQAKEQSDSRSSRTIAKMVANNLRKLHSDEHIKDLYRTPGAIVFGTQEYLGTRDDHQIGIIKLPEISEISANKLLRILPKKDFPELKGITDWAQIPFNHINEDLLVRLESYF